MTSTFRHGIGIRFFCLLQMNLKCFVHKAISIWFSTKTTFRETDKSYRDSLCHRRTGLYLHERIHFSLKSKKTRTLTRHSTETRTNATKKELLLIKQIAEMKEFIIMAKRALFVVYNTMGKQSSCNLPIPNWFCLTTTNAHKNEKAHAIHRVSRHRFFICWYSFQLFWQANRKSQQ